MRTNLTPEEKKDVCEGIQTLFSRFATKKEVGKLIGRRDPQQIVTRGGKTSREVLARIRLAVIETDPRRQQRKTPSNEIAEAAVPTILWFDAARLHLLKAAEIIQEQAKRDVKVFQPFYLALQEELKLLANKLQIK